MEDDHEIELTTLRRERDAFQAFVVKAAAEAAIMRKLGAENLKLFAPAVMKALRANMDGDELKIQVLDRNGRARTMLDPASCKFRAVTADDLVAELSAELDSASSPVHSDHSATTLDGLTSQQIAQRHSQMLRDQRAARAAANAPLSEAEKAEARAANPFRRATLNLTQQMTLTRRDSAFAAELERAAAAA